MTPLANKLDEVHEVYNDLFLWARSEFHACMIHGSFTKPEVDLTRLAATLDKFQSKRQSDERLRDELRYHAQDILEKIQWQEGRRFLMTVINYFLLGGGIAPSVHDLDIQIQVIRAGGQNSIDTPSMRVYSELSGLVRTPAPDIERIVACLDKARNDLNQAHVNVMRAFRRAQEEVLRVPV